MVRPSNHLSPLNVPLSLSSIHIARSAAGGVLPALFGSKRPLALAVTGDGTWKRWTGGAALNLSGRPTARLGLTARDGQFGLRGTLAPSQFLKGKLMRLTAPVVRVSGSASLKDRILDGRLVLGSQSLRVAATGALDRGLLALTRGEC